MVGILLRTPVEQFPDDDWPTVAEAYTDEFGSIDLDVYEAAGRLWSWGRRFSQSKIQDEGFGRDLLLKMAANITEKRSKGRITIENLDAYLSTSFRRAVLAELRLRTARDAKLNKVTESSLKIDLDKKILIEEYMEHMDPWLLRVFRYRVLGYTFDTIGRWIGEDGDSVKSKYHKHMSRLIKSL